MVAACSAGADSTALALLLAQAEPCQLILAHVDHGIHERSAAAAEFVRTLATALGVPFALRRLTLAPSERSEATMREHRYAALVEIAREHGASRIATAHHAEDEVETVVFRLMRGTGPRGLCGIRAERELAPGIRLVRPLLGMAKRELAELVAARGLTPIEDPTNALLDKARNRIRHELLPRLRAAHGPELDARVRELAARAREVDRVVSGHATRWLATCARRSADGGMDLAWAGLPPARPFLAAALRMLHEELTGETAASAWVERVVGLCRRPGRSRVSGGSALVAERTRAGIALTKTCLAPSRSPFLRARGARYSLAPE